MVDFLFSCTLCLSMLRGSLRRRLLAFLVKCFEVGSDGFSGEKAIAKFNQHFFYPTEICVANAIQFFS